MLLSFWDSIDILYRKYCTIFTQIIIFGKVIFGNLTTTVESMILLFFKKINKKCSYLI